MNLSPSTVRYSPSVKVAYSEARKILLDYRNPEGHGNPKNRSYEVLREVLGNGTKASGPLLVRGTGRTPAIGLTFHSGFVVCPDYFIREDRLKSELSKIGFVCVKPTHLDPMPYVCGKSILIVRPESWADQVEELERADIDSYLEYQITLDLPTALVALGRVRGERMHDAAKLLILQHNVTQAVLVKQLAHCPKEVKQAILGALSYLTPLAKEQGEIPWFDVVSGAAKNKTLSFKTVEGEIAALVRYAPLSIAQYAPGSSGAAPYIMKTVMGRLWDYNKLPVEEAVEATLAYFKDMPVTASVTYGVQDALRKSCGEDIEKCLGRPHDSIKSLVEDVHVVFVRRMFATALAKIVERILGEKMIIDDRAGGQVRALEEWVVKAKGRRASEIYNSHLVT